MRICTYVNNWQYSIRDKRPRVKNSVHNIIIGKSLCC